MARSSLNRPKKRGSKDARSAEKRIRQNRRLRESSPVEEESFGHASTALATLPPPPRTPSRFWARVKRPLWIVVQTVGIGAAIVGAIAVGRLVRTHLHTSESFAITELHVEGGERLDPSLVLETAGLEAGANVFEHAPEDIEARLRDHPWIAEADVERRLPGTFEIRIEERQAVASLMLGSDLFLVGDDATVFKSFELGDPIDVPVLSGIERERFVADRAYRTSLLVEMVALLHDYRMAGLWRREPIGEIHIGNADEVTLYVGEDGMEVRIGRGPFLAKLRRLRRVLDRLGDERALYVFLDNVRRPDRVTVRLREAPEPRVADVTADVPPEAS